MAVSGQQQSFNSLAGEWLLWVATSTGRRNT